MTTTTTTRRPRGPCPQCRAPVDQRVESAGFGTTRSELCGVCGYDFGPSDDDARGNG